MSEYDDPDEEDADQGDPLVEEQNNNMNSSEEEEAEEKAAQNALKNGLRNISFADDVEVNEIDGYVSIFKDISFANASRGMFPWLLRLCLHVEIFCNLIFLNYSK